MKNNYIIEEYNSRNNDVEDFIWQYGTIFHQYNFLSSVGENYTCFVVKESSTNSIKGVLPLVKSVKFGLKSYHIPPFTYQFGPVTDNNIEIEPNEILKLVYTKICKNAQLDFKFFIDDQNVFKYKYLNYSIEAYQTFLIRKKTNFSINDVHSSKRRYLKKLIQLFEKGDIKILIGKKCIPDLLRLYKVNSKEVGFDSKINVLEKLIGKLNENQFFVFVLYSKDNQPLAGSFCPYDMHSAYYLINASIKNNNKLLNKINILSTFLAINKARDLDLNFDFEGSSIFGVAQYYKMMGGKPKIIFRVQKTKSVFYQSLKIIKNIIK